MSYLVSIAIGPIQDFIASARRTRDLWYGSRLLSEVGKAAARAMRQDGVELIFPYSDDLDRDLLRGSDFTVVNKLLGTVAANTDAEVAHKAAAWKRATRDFLIAEFQRSLPAIRRSAAIDEKLAVGQLPSIVEFNAAWTPLDVAYPEARLRVEELLNGRKALRDFPPFQGKAGRAKSSLDGVREGVINHRRTERHEIKKSEELDAIGVLKRCGDFGRKPHFESTHDVAGEPLLVRLRRTRTTDVKAFQDFLRHTLDVPGCAEFLYRAKPFDDYEGLALTEEQREAFDTLKHRLIHDEPEPAYYAILAGDGDKIGAAIRELQEPEEHRQFSTKLSQFASDAAKIIDGSDGEPIYTGGDDVLALLPLHTALAVARSVRNEFSHALPGKTFSAGMAVVHAMDSLRAGIRLAHQAEKDAKKAGGDSLAVVIAPRSGANVEVVGEWDVLMPMLEEITRRYRTPKPEQLGKGFAYELRNLLREGWDAMAPPDSNNVLDPVLGDLALAIAGKKAQSAPAKDLVNRYVLKWGGPPGLQPAPWPASSTGSAPQNPRQKLDRLTSALLVARFFARAQNEAEV
jgi:CRISPR-associated protein Cmr2